MGSNRSTLSSQTISFQLAMLFDSGMADTIWKSGGLGSEGRDLWTPTISYLLHFNVLTVVTAQNRSDIEDIHDLLSDDFFNASFLLPPKVSEGQWCPPTPLHPTPPRTHSPFQGKPIRGACTHACERSAQRRI